MEKFFHLKENGTTVSTEILAGLTTFFAMAYIIVVNPQILSQTGMPWGGARRGLSGAVSRPAKPGRRSEHVHQNRRHRPARGRLSGQR